MEARYLARTDPTTLLDPDAAAWGRSAFERVKLEGTPLGLQPTGAIRNAWLGKKIGAVDRVDVAAVHDGRQLAFRLEWSDSTESRSLSDTTAFPDAAAILLPAVDGAAVFTMGAPGAAVNAWYWRADDDERGRHVVSEGLGTTRTLDRELVRARGAWKEGRWRVVIARSLRVQTSEPVAQLRAGETTGFGIAVWDGANAERGGIKSYSGDWRELRLEATPLARR